MTRRDYIALAGALLEARRESVYNVTWQACMDDVTARIAVVLQADNPRFDADRFLRAAMGLEGASGR